MTDDLIDRLRHMHLKFVVPFGPINDAAVERLLIEAATALRTKSERIVELEKERDARAAQSQPCGAREPISRAAPEAEPSAAPETDSTRDLVRRFFALRLSEKREIAQAFGLLLTDEWAAPETERWKTALTEAGRRGLLSAVGDAVAHAEGQS